MCKTRHPIIKERKIQNAFLMYLQIPLNMFLDYCVQREIKYSMSNVSVMKCMNHWTHHHINESKDETNMQ